MGWQTEAVVQLIAGDTIINPSGSFTYSSAPGVGNLIATVAPTSGTDSFGNHYISGVSSYGASIATQLGSGFISFYTGSLSVGWSLAATITTDAFGDIALNQASGHEVLTRNNVLDDGAGGMAVTSLTVNGSSNTGSGNNGGVTSGPSGTVSSFPAAGPNHTHTEIHQHPL